MAATVTTKEIFEKGVTKKQINEEIRLRIKAGAIKIWAEKPKKEWTLYTEWNVIGEQ